jgi:hypothetical protein
VDDLKKEFPTSNASKNELGYQEVLDRFESANEITIITLAMSELVLIGFVHRFSSIILTRARRKSESILSYGALF